tara:strand:- start:506 stop:985 length:480 start_codon:yes stop_codon:yes gene_type:complete
MATPTYTLIDSVTLGSSAASVTFSGISATGKGDLVLVANATGTGAATVRSAFNSDTTATNYHFVQMYGDGTIAASSSLNQSVFGTITTSPSLNVIQAMDYSATDKHKSFLYQDGRADQNTRAVACRWANTSAITSWELFTSANQFAAGSTFHLYQLVSE